VKYTPKQIEKYKRQKYISLIEKIGKNLFRMFRDESVDAQKFIKRFSDLMKELESSGEIRVDSHYLKESKDYYTRLYAEFSDDDFDDEYLNRSRKEQMSNLNRLQKLKNKKSYNRASNKNRD
jgi:flagellar motor component MotA